MSLIEEALQRAQVTVSPPPPPPSTASAQSPPPAMAPSVRRSAASPSAPRRVGVLLLGAVGIAAGAWMGWRLLGHHARQPAANHLSRSSGRSASSQMAMPSTMPGAREPKRASALAAAGSVLASTTASPVREYGLTLNGVVVGPGEPLAVINGEILRLGETVNGATLVAIEESSATIRRDGQDVVLRTNR